MRLYFSATLALLAVCSGSVASAQYGLYGSPETLPVPTQAATPTYTAGSAYPTTGAPATGYAPAQPQYRAPAGYQQQPTYQQAYPQAAGYQQNYQPTAGYQPAPQAYRYPAQTPTTAMYQPYQPGSQYRYPAPGYGRPVARTAAVAPAQQVPAMPTPAGMVPTPAAPGDYTPVLNDPSQPNPNLMNQMMSEQNAWSDCYGAGNCRHGYGQPNYGYCPNTDCSEGGCGYCNPWYASFSTLALGRSDSRRLWTSYATNDETNQLTNTDFGMQWRWGGEVTLGYRFCCECVPYGLQATFWSTEQMSGERITTNPGGYVSTPLNIAPLTFGGVAAQNWFDGAEEHRLNRWDEYYNFEVNLVRQQMAWACDSRWDIGWSVGVRYFRFNENLTFASVRQGATWGDLPDMAFLSDTITNSLIGPQFGFDAAYCVTDNVRLFISPKVGIYANFMESNFQAQTGDGVNGVGPYGSFPVHSTRTGLSFLTQIDAGVDWQFTRNWSARAGYRVVAITGMGLADDQFPQYIVDTPDIANIQHVDSLILHGAFVGVTYNY